MESEPAAQTKSSIVVVDDDASVRRSLTRLLATHGFEVKGYESAESLLSEISITPPDCVIADLAMPGLNGLDLQKSLTELELDFPIVFVTGAGDIRSSVTAMRAGAVDFLAKPVEQQDLLAAVNRALARGRAARAVASELAVFNKRFESLTQRERNVFELVVAGYLNKQIAATLGIAEKTVKVHRARVMRKMSVKSVAGLARVAERIGIPQPTR
jgi:FixJ family two-component response regulator